MSTIPALCCPQPAFNALHPHEIPRTPPDPCADAKPVTICGVAEPLPIAPVCEPLELPYLDCKGIAQTAVGTTCDMVQVVPHPNAVMKVQICGGKDIEKQILCEEITEHRIVVITDFTDPALPVTTYWNLNTGSAWAGDVSTLHTCPDTDLESDPREVCVDGTTYTQWVVKSDGEPTGTVYYTDINGALVTLEEGAVITLGACPCCEQAIASAYADDLSPLVPATSIAVIKPECCAIQVTTDVGSYIVPKKVQSHSSIDFKCPVTVVSVEIISGTCDLADVLITTMKSVGC